MCCSSYWQPINVVRDPLVPMGRKTHGRPPRQCRAFVEEMAGSDWRWMVQERMIWNGCVRRVAAPHYHLLLHTEDPSDLGDFRDITTWSVTNVRAMAAMLVRCSLVQRFQVLSSCTTCHNILLFIQPAKLASAYCTSHFSSLPLKLCWIKRSCDFLICWEMQRHWTGRCHSRQNAQARLRESFL